MKQRLYRFMMGRNGTDELAKAESWLVLGVMAASFLLLPALVQTGIFPRFAAVPIVIVILILRCLTIALLAHLYFRMFSKNLAKRRKENQWYLNARYQRVVRRNRRKTRRAQRDLYRYFKCPTCRQQVRVPSGHGKICITCPKCRTEFIKRS